MTFHCDNAEKQGNLCLGYSNLYDDEPCTICKLCIKCMSGYYQLGEIPDELLKENDDED